MIGWQASAQKTFVKKNWYNEEQTLLKEVITLTRSDSSLHGPYQRYYANQSLAMEGFYFNNESDSLWKYYFENGQYRAIGRFAQGHQTSKWKYYYETGKVKAEGSFWENLREGHWTYFYENGTEKSSGSYHADQKQGFWDYYYEDGTLKAQAYYEKGAGLYKEFYSAGALKTEGQNVDDRSQGLWTYYYESGEKEAEGAFENGLRTGQWSYYHKSGQLSAQGYFELGEKTGIWKYYHEDGSISAEGALTGGQQDGYWKLYYPSGEIKGEGRFDQGTGEYAEYYASGKLKARGQVIDGKKEGRWAYFSEEGLEDGVAEYKNGKGEYRGFYPDGTLKMTGMLDDGKRTGEWTLYNPTGEVAGIYRPVYEDEQPIFRQSKLQEDLDKRQSDKPEYKFKNKKLRYFNPRINEYVGKIVGTNPVWTVVGSAPLALEYYFQERLGYEAELVLHKKPFFLPGSRVDYNEPYTLGGELRLRQKFYNADTPAGMFYFGHQVSFAALQHKSNILDSSNVFLAPVDAELKASENRFSYGVFIGNRWMERIGDSGFTIDFNLGLAVGQRQFSLRETHAEAKSIFSSLPQNKLYLPIIFTLNIGYAGPKRRTTSF